MEIIEILLGVASAIYAAFEGSKWRSATTLKRIFIVIACIIAVFVGYDKFNDYRKAKLIEEVETKFGDISSADKTNFSEFMIGDKGSIMRLIDGEFSFNHLPDLIKIYIKNNKPYVNIVVWSYKLNPEPEALAVINDNTWTIYDDKDYEYNNDDSTFEMVERGDRNVYFRVQIVDTIAHISGMVYSKYDDGAYFYSCDSTTNKEATGEGGGCMQIVVDRSTPFLLLKFVKPYFKYPREKYLGVKAE